MGVPEWSSIPLALVTIFRAVPDLANAWPIVNKCSLGSFALLFLATRVVWWSMRNIEYWRDMFPFMGTGAVERSGVPVWHLWSWVLTNALLTLLQYFWAFKIVKLARKHIQGGKVKQHG